jgi:hypothetical protein
MSVWRSLELLLRILSRRNEVKIQKCTNCGVEKELTEENFESQAHGQFNKECKECRHSYMKAWREEAKKNPDYLRSKALRELYHTTVEWYEDQLRKQEGHCALCFSTVQSKCGRRLSVDHDHGCCPTKHACGKCNRGLLCFNCNKKLGMLEIFMRDCVGFNITPNEGTWLSKAISYLSHWKSVHEAMENRDGQRKLNV